MRQGLSLGEEEEREENEGLLFSVQPPARKGGLYTERLEAPLVQLGACVRSTFLRLARRCGAGKRLGRHHPPSSRGSGTAKADSDHGAGFYLQNLEPAPAQAGGGSRRRTARLENPGYLRKINIR